MLRQHENSSKFETSGPQKRRCVLWKPATMVAALIYIYAYFHKFTVRTVCFFLNLLAKLRRRKKSLGWNGPFCFYFSQLHVVSKWLKHVTCFTLEFNIFWAKNSYYTQGKKKTYESPLWNRNWRLLFAIHIFSNTFDSSF